MIFWLFFLWRMVDVIITLIAEKTVPYLGFFPYKDLLVQYHLPSFLSHLASFDGVHYTQIADNGYAQNEQAFFPLYPLAIKALTFVTGNRLVSGLLISNIAFFIGLVLFQKYVKTLEGKATGVSPVLFLLVFPTSFFFGAVYTEGLFFLLFIGSLYFMKKKRYWLAGICAALSSSTRLIGLFLFIPFAFSLHDKGKFSLKSIFKLAFRYWALLLSPFVGFAGYAFYLWKTLGDPLFFFHAQPSFGANRSTQLISLPQVYFRYLKIFFTADLNFQYVVSVLEFTIFTFVFILLILDLLRNYKNKERLGLNVFSFANLLLPTLTGTFSSIPRYALFSISAFLFLSSVKNLGLKGALFITLFLLHVFFLIFFIQGYFIS